MLNSTDWTDYVRSNPSTPSNSPPPNSVTNSNSPYNNGSTMNLDDYLINPFGFEGLYPYNTLGTTIPMTATSYFSANPNFGFDDVNNTTSCSSNVIANQHHGGVNENESQNHQTLDQLAAAAALISASRDDGPSMSENIRQNRNRPHLMPLNIEPATTNSNIYRFSENFNFADSMSSSPSSAVTMPPTPVFFEPGFLDGVTNTITDGFSFGINPTTLTSEQLLENNQISVSRSHSYDSVSSSSQQSTIFTSDKIIENPQTVTPAAITINQPYQPNFAPSLSRTPSALGVETDYFNSKKHPKGQCEQANKNNNVRRRSRTLSNPPNIKAEPSTPALSPPESPGASVSSSSSPPSPSPPQTPNYMRRVSISPTIIEEEEEVMMSNPNPVPLVTSSSPFVPDLPNINSVNPRLTQSAAANVMRPVIQQYLNSSNPAALGEKTVMVLTSKVAQKSYGTEKRFLCPPPTTLILGSNWWSPSPHNHNVGHSSNSTTFSPPKISVGISGEQGHQQGILEWISPSGNPLDPNSCSEMAFSGKCVSKHLYINDADEKRKRVEVLVNIQSPMGHNFGTFASKPVKVISKPSKKRQSVKNMECKSQTVSTKYLGVSMQNTNQTFGPWYSNGNNMSSNPNEQPHPCFVARTGSWDPFIIWIVDPHHVKGKDDHPQQPPHPNFPRPPPAAIKTNSNNPTPIHYNQPIVLQCLTTGMTSPVMIIRKVDKGSMVIGGGILEPMNGYSDGEEAIGDPVSQLHKVSFQIKDANIATPSPVTSPTFQPSNQAHPPGPGTYLACLGDVVGMQRANEGRKIINSSTVGAGLLDMKINSPILSPTSEIPPVVAAALAGAQTNFPYDSTPLSESAVVSTEGGKVVRKRRVSSSVVIRPTTTLSKSTLAKNRRRVNSLSGVASEVDLAKFASTTRNSMNVTDAAVWTIVGTDCASYTFYSPQNLMGRQVNPSSSHIISPLPPSTPVTPLPIISTVITAASSSSNSSHVQYSATPNTVTIYGENFTRDLMVWFGDKPSPRTEFRSKDCLVCLLPEELIYEIDRHNSVKLDIVNASLQGRHLHLLPHGRMNGGRPILFSRNDGIVFRTDKVWP
ncbi:20007_t:CDS:2 [Funneliformis geosporum]|uniref:7465_t:CDS:1 n=1 Tax=Funneliformis geosporum TaxID=1117311 RepID=A0A9W4SHM9_9GLOM|nr:20007_t:CDS:2 [Funneliformis geosporum]CAI2169305.1 7465_t:CDS:2 [Funneliformis geosporum]